MDVRQFKQHLANAAFAFRGYNVTNLGRSGELLRHPKYGSIVREQLRTTSRICSDLMHRRVDLIQRVRRQRETTLKTYGEALGLILAMELAQLELLRHVFEIELKAARLTFGFSLGEVAALVAGGVLPLEDALRVLLALSPDCARLAADVCLGVLFSRGPVLPLDEVERLRLKINQEGQGVIGISAYLSPNSLLLIGQGDTIDRFKRRIHEILPAQIYLRKNAARWPPLHTPIMWQKCVPNRSGVLLHSVSGGFTSPRPPVLSLVTGKFSYNDVNARDILQRWVDHPQQLWDVVYETLALGVETIVHVGPQPNIIPATYKRLSDNVEAQTHGSVGMRALQGMVRRPWLKALLPQRTALLRAPSVQHVILEDWLLQQDA